MRRDRSELVRCPAMVGPPPSCKDPLACQVSPKYVILTPDNRVSRAAQISKRNIARKEVQTSVTSINGGMPPPLFANDFLIGKTSPKAGGGTAGEGQTNLLGNYLRQKTPRINSLSD